MAAFVQTRSTFGSGVDFHTALGFDMASRKYPMDEYTPIFTEDHQTKYGEAFRALTQNQHQQQQQQQQSPTNHFTFNQSITHVNLINNRFQIDLAAQHSYPNDYPVPEDMSISNIQTPSSNINPYFKPDMNSNNRVNGNAYTEHSHVDYPSPPSLINSSPSDHLMSLYPQQHFPAKHTTLEDLQGMHNFNKFLPDHSLIQNQLHHQDRIKSDNEYSPSFYSDTSGGMMGNNISFSSAMIPHSTMNKLTPIFPPSGIHKQRDHDVEQVNETQKCKNTIEGTKTSVRRFKRWYKEKYSKDIDMNSVNRFNAPELLKDFFLDIRDTRPGRIGNEYEPVTLTTYRNGLRRYFLYRKVPPAPDNFDLTDKTFDLVNKHLVTKRDDLKRKGKGNHPNAIESITPEQLEKMWASGAIGTHAPRPLLRLQWWYNTVYHGVRGRMAHHDLTTEDFSLKRGNDGKLTMEYNKNSAYPMHNTLSSKLEPPKKKKFKGLVKQTDGGDRDPLRAFEIFKAHRPPGISSFYLTPKHKPKGNIWFNKVPMGKNSIGRIMREIKAISGI